MADEYKLTVEIKNEQPVLLEDFTRSFLALADEYQAYVSLHGGPETSPDAQLYIREIRPGSIFAELVAQAPVVAPQVPLFINNAKSVIEFAKYLVGAYGFLSGKDKEKPPLSKPELERLSGIVEPIAKDAASQVNINGNHNNVVVHNITLNSVEANAVQNTARREIDYLKEPSKREHEKVLLYFYQARDDAKSDRGDRAKIESISTTPVKVVFADEHLKERALGAERGPFKSAYVVDVSVETIDGRPALYRVTSIHDIFDRAV